MELRNREKVVVEDACWVVISRPESILEASARFAEQKLTTFELCPLISPKVEKGGQCNDDFKYVFKQSPSPPPLPSRGAIRMLVSAGQITLKLSGGHKQELY